MLHGAGNKEKFQKEIREQTNKQNPAGAERLHDELNRVFRGENWMRQGGLLLWGRWLGRGVAGTRAGSRLLSRLVSLVCDHAWFFRHRRNIVHTWTLFSVFNQTWWLTPVIIVFKKLRQEDCCKFRSSLGYCGGLNSLLYLNA